jgi:PAS domain S-box-containing protein
MTGDMGRVVESTVRETGSTRLAAFLLVDGETEWSNRSFGDLFPTEADEATGDFYDRLASVCERDVSAPETVDGEAQTGLVVDCDTGDGSRFYRRTSYPVPAAVGGERLELFEDVTDVVELWERLELLEQLADSARDGMYAADAVGRIEYCNESFANLLGTTPAALRGRRVAAVVAKSDQDAFTGALDRIERNHGTDGTTVEVSYVRADGESVPVAVSLAHREDTLGTGGHVGVARDVSERKEQRRRLDQYERLVEGADYPLYVLDEAGHIELANEAMGSLVGRQSDDLVGQDIRTLLDDTSIERGEQAVRSLLAADDREWERYELTLQTPGGPDRRFEAKVGIIQDDRGGYGGVAVSLRDVTRREQRGAEIDVLLELLTCVGQESIQRELQAIETTARELRDRLDDDQRAVAGEIAEGVARVGGVSRNIDAVARIVETDERIVTQSLSAVVDDAVTAVTGTSGRTTVDVDVPNVSVAANPAVGVAIAELVENALAHGGELPTVSVSAAVAETTVQVTVADDGPGIPDTEFLVLTGDGDASMEPGSGLGLWLARWVVDASGGEITADTGPTGTNITITLDRPTTAGPDPELLPDRSGAPAATERDGHELRLPDSGDISVLYVDRDDAAVARLEQYVESAAPSMSVHGTTDVDVAVDRLPAVDCLVSETLGDGAWERVTSAAREAGVPVILYTDTDHRAIDETTCRAAETLVQKSVEQPTAGLLVEKIRALTGGRDDAETDGDRTEAAAVVERMPTVAVTLRAADGDVDDHSLTPDTETADVAPGTLSAIRASVDDSRPVDTVFRTTEGGEQKYYRYCRLPLGEHDDGGWLEIACDVTERTERRERVALLEGLVDTTDDGISVVDASGRIQYHNRGFAEILGRADMGGDHARTYMADGELERGQAAIQRLLATPSLESELHEIEMVRADGSHVRVADHFTVRRVDGDYAGVINVVRHGSEHRARRRRLDQYERLVDCAHDPMYVLDADGYIERLNVEMASFVGHPREHLLGVDVREVFPMAKLAPGLRAIRRLLSEPLEWDTHELALAGGDGTVRTFEVTVGVLLENGQYGCSVASLRDISERKRQQEHLELLTRVPQRLLGERLPTALDGLRGTVESLWVDSDTPEAELATDLRRHCQRALDVAASGRLFQETLRPGHPITTYDLPTLLADSHQNIAPTTDDVPGIAVTGRADLPAALGLLADHLLTGERGVLPVVVEATADTVALRFQTGASLPDPPASLTDLDFGAREAVTVWLVEWVVTASGGTLRRNDYSMTVELDRANS